jgi:hypothetical protein
LDYEHVKTVVAGVILVIGIHVFAAAALVITGAAIEILGVVSPNEEQEKRPPRCAPTLRAARKGCRAA